MTTLFKNLSAQISIAWLKLAISIAAIGVIVARIIYPDLKIDAITFGLIIVAILPWLTELIDTAKFPGGWEIKFRDLRDAAAKVTGDISTESGPTPTEGSNLALVAQSDPNLALVGLRIEIEKRLREYARQQSLDEHLPLTVLLGDLSQREVLPPDTVKGLKQLIYAGNNAAHGAKVQDGVAEWALDVGPSILKALDEQLNSIEQKDSPDPRTVR